MYLLSSLFFTASVLLLNLCVMSRNHPNASSTTYHGIMLQAMLCSSILYQCIFVFVKHIRMMCHKILFNAIMDYHN
jgi:hypothetical protein